jgi:hypothetical protein
MRMITSSTTPPKYPLIAPRVTPTVEQMATVESPTSTATRAPKMILVSTSVPFSSVPSQWAMDGASNWRVTLTWASS